MEIMLAVIKAFSERTTEELVLLYNRVLGPIPFSMEREELIALLVDNVDLFLL
jgi:hypothetical protein